MRAEIFVNHFLIAIIFTTNYARDLKILWTDNINEL
jgi:hypothetical protein